MRNTEEFTKRVYRPGFYTLLVCGESSKENEENLSCIYESKKGMIKWGGKDLGKFWLYSVHGRLLNAAKSFHNACASCARVNVGISELFDIEIWVCILTRFSHHAHLNTEMKTLQGNCGILLNLEENEDYYNCCSKDDAVLFPIKEEVEENGKLLQWYDREESTEYYYDQDQSSHL